eukprot:scaffold2671_cov167-Amphora_coffeaeformis.AAC.18
MTIWVSRGGAVAPTLGRRAMNAKQTTSSGIYDTMTTRSAPSCSNHRQLNLESFIHWGPNL